MLLHRLKHRPWIQKGLENCVILINYELLGYELDSDTELYLHVILFQNIYHQPNLCVKYTARMNYSITYTFRLIL